MVSLTGMIEKECHYSLIALSLSPRSCSNAKGYCCLLAGNCCFWLEKLRNKIDIKLIDDATTSYKPFFHDDPFLFFRFTCTHAYKNLLNELGDQAGQHEMIAENLSTSVVSELTNLVKQLKDDRRKVRANLVCAFGKLSF